MKQGHHGGAAMKQGHHGAAAIKQGHHGAAAMKQGHHGVVVALFLHDSRETPETAKRKDWKSLPAVARARTNHTLVSIQSRLNF